MAGSPTILNSNASPAPLWMNWLGEFRVTVTLTWFASIPSTTSTVPKTVEPLPQPPVHPSRLRLNGIACALDVPSANHTLPSATSDTTHVFKTPSCLAFIAVDSSRLTSFSCRPIVSSHSSTGYEQE